MNRKTNLFYNSGPDSNFLTFSNYTEALTGNIIATNAKLFPGKFICLYIPELNAGNGFDNAKETFIKQYLVSYYENKLAILRDKAKEENIKTEEILNPLDYLLKAIYKFSPTAKITHIGYICEQEYNSTFMDNICIIEASDQVKEYSITNGQHTQHDTALTATNSDTSKLHGWESYTNDFLNGYTPSYDFNDDSYSSDTSVGLLLNSDPASNIEFNVLIPLFNIYNWDSNSQDPHYYNPDDDETLSENVDDSGLILNSAATRNQYDIPLGIWISNKKITLERTEQTTGEYNPSWSLCISSQFKPFPYSNNMPNEIESSGNGDIFGTFAMIMAKQGYILDEFESLNNSISTLSGRLDNLTNIVNNLEIQANGGEPIEDDDEEISLDDIQDTIEILNTQVGTLSSSVATVTDTLNNINPSWVTQLYHDFYEGPNGNDGLLSTINGFDGRIDEVEGNITTVNGNISTLNTRVGNLQTSVTTAASQAITAIERTSYMIGTARLQWGNDNYLRNANSLGGQQTNLSMLINSYENADIALASRLSNLDGTNYQGSGEAFVPAAQGAIAQIETKLEQIKQILLNNNMSSTDSISADDWANVVGPSSGATHGIGSWS